MSRPSNRSAPPSIDDLLGRGSDMLASADSASREGKLDVAEQLYHEAVVGFAKVLRNVPVSVGALVSRGYALLQLAQRTRALADLSKAVELSPGEAMPRLALGQYYESIQAFPEAERQYRAAARRDPTSPVPYLLLARSRLTRGARKEALASASRAIEIAPKYADAYVARARAHAALGDIQRALADAETAVRFDPQNVDGLMTRGLLRGDRGREDWIVGNQTAARESFRQAVEDFDATLALAPGMPEARYRRAAARAQLGDLTAAVDELTDLLDQLPDYAEALQLRATCLKDLGRTNQAVKDLDRLIQLRRRTASDGHDPILVDAMATRGEARWVTGDSAGALADLRGAIELDPKRAELHRSIGVMLEQEGEPEEALEAYRRVIRLGDRSAGAYRNRADALVAIGRERDALRDYTKALTLEPDSFETLSARGELLWSLGDATGALEDLGRAIELDPNWPTLYRARGEILEEAGRVEEALDDYKRAIKLGDKSGEAYLSKADAEAALGEHKKAVRDYGKALQLDPNLVAAYEGRGRSLLELVASDPLAADAALRDFDAAISIEPTLAAGFAGRGDAHAALGHDERAVVDYDRALDLDGSDVVAQRGRVLALLRLGDSHQERRLFGSMFDAYEEALRGADRTISVDPSDPYSYYLRSLALRVLEAFDSAADAALEGLDRPGGDDPSIGPWLSRERADALRLWGEEIRIPEKLDEALAVVRTAQERDTGQVGAGLHELSGHVLTAMGRYKEALDAFDSAIEAGLDPGMDYDPIWAELGRFKACLLRPEVDAAVDAGRRAMSAAAGRPTLEKWAHVALGLALERAGKPGPARAEFDQALGSAPDASAFAGRADRFEYFRAFDHLEADRRTAVKHAPDDPATLNGLAWFYGDVVPAADLTEAYGLAKRAVELEGTGDLRAEYLDTLGWIALKRGRNPEALRCLREATRLRRHDLGFRVHLEAAKESTASAEATDRAPRRTPHGRVASSKRA
jgi:tetratricopeptide (TPR) repeat protein